MNDSKLQLWYMYLLKTGKYNKLLIYNNNDCFYVANYTEELLTMHEHQVEVMKGYYEQNKHLFKMVEKRATMFAKMEEYEVMNPELYKMLVNDYCRWCTYYTDS